MNPFRKNERQPEPQGESATTLKPNRWLVVHDILHDKVVEVATGMVIAEAASRDAHKALAQFVEAANLGARLMVTGDGS